jgi:hypothetical protein
MDETSGGSEKCARCRDQIRDGDLVLRDHGEWYHARCARRLNPKGVPEKPAAVQCVICRVGIGSIAELSLSGSAPAHVRCRAAQSTEPLPRAGVA